MSETTQPFRPPRGSAMTRAALSVLTAAAAAASAASGAADASDAADAGSAEGFVAPAGSAAPAAGCGYPGFTECGAWGRADEVRSFTVYQWTPGAVGAVGAAGDR
ncbi:hypothetical protein [Kitasatospora sp. NPDC059462]|uniref:hypothetical protein n=1 Tax=Kitasatospora sp. NPDC059462 TaxID=3346841 RepID=UPI0036CCB3A2